MKTRPRFYQQLGEKVAKAFKDGDNEKCALYWKQFQKLLDSEDEHRDYIIACNTFTESYLEARTTNG